MYNSIIDIILGSRTIVFQEKFTNNVEWNRKIIGPKNNPAVLIFLGRNVDFNTHSAIYKKFKNKTKIIYKLPNKLISEDVDLSKKLINEIVDDVQNIIKEYDVVWCYGLSLGCLLATYVSNKFSKSINKLYLISPGSRVSDIFWDSFITKSQVKKAKANGLTSNDYKIKLKKFDPIENLNNLIHTDLQVFVGKFDAIFPYKYTKQFIDKIKQLKIPVDIKIFSCGHYLTGAIGIYLTSAKYYS